MNDILISFLVVFLVFGTLFFWAHCIYWEEAVAKREIELDWEAIWKARGEGE